MKRNTWLWFSIVLVLQACSSSTFHSTDRVTGEPVESVKMGFWDEATVILWGVPYDRFRFELQAIGAQKVRWVAVVDCKNINDGEAFSISVDGVEKKYKGRLYGEKMMAYDIPSEDVGAMGKAKIIAMRIEHRDKSDSAELNADQVRAIRELYERHAR